MYPQYHPYLSAPKKRSARSGFTLIELLMVVAVIMILAGITFGISRGVQNAQARAGAKAELAVLAQALEQFKSANGDYPWTNDVESEKDSLVLAKSLLGWKKFVRSGTTTTFKDKSESEVPDSGLKAFVDPTKLSTSGTIPNTVASKPTNLAFVDPWGNEYVYLYKESDSWENFGYILYSKGGDGDDVAVGGNGILTSALRDNTKNIDNIYSGE